MAKCSTMKLWSLEDQEYGQQLHHGACAPSVADQYTIFLTQGGSWLWAIHGTTDNGMPKDNYSKVTKWRDWKNRNLRCCCSHQKILPDSTISGSIWKRQISGLKSWPSKITLYITINHNIWLIIERIFYIQMKQINELKISFLFISHYTKECLISKKKTGTTFLQLVPASLSPYICRYLGWNSNPLLPALAASLRIFGVGNQGTSSGWPGARCWRRKIWRSEAF